MRYADWGTRSARWSGIRSETIDVCGTSVHFLQADAGPASSPDAATHLLVHALGGSATAWLDVMGPLAASGPVVAVDLPGTLAGHTASPHPRAPRAQTNARFLRAFTTELGLRDAVVHGWSMGGLVAVLFADLAPERVGRLVLTAPTLPGPLSSREAFGWQTLGRLGLSAGPPVVRGFLRLSGGRLIDLKLRMLSDSGGSGESPIGAWDGNLSLMSPEMRTLWVEELRGLGSRTRLLGDTVTAFASATSSMYVDRRPALRAVDRVAAPTLLLWGDRDPLIARAVIDDLMVRRPDWALHVFESAGHLLPLETPADYVDVVGTWLREQRVPPTPKSDTQDL